MMAPKITTGPGQMDRISKRSKRGGVKHKKKATETSMPGFESFAQAKNTRGAKFWKKKHIIGIKRRHQV